MCWSKEDLLIWVNMEKYDRKILFRLCTTPDKKAYNDYFTLEYPHGGSKGTEVLYTLPFNEIKSLSCNLVRGSDLYKLNLDLTDGDECLREITVPRHCFPYYTFKRMVKAHAKAAR